MRYLMAAAPVAIDDSVYYTAMNTNLVVTATSNPPGLIANDIDIDGVPQLASIVTNPTSGSLIAFASNGTFTYRPNPGFKGVDTFSYRIIDGTQNSNVAIASVAVGTPLLGRANRDSNVVASIPIENTGMGSGEAIVDYTTGDLIFAESVTPSDTLVYRSDALTRPIISVVTRVSPVGPLPTAISARLTFNGIAGTVYDYNTSFLAAGQDVRFTLQADGSNLPTGMYDYSMLIATTVSGVTTNQFFAGKQAIVNRNSSEFGAGWWLEGLDRIFDSPIGALLVRGNGNTFWFRKSGTSYLHADGDVEFNTLVKSGSVFVLTSKTGIVSNFSGIGLLTSVMDTNGNTFTYTYADRNSDGIANELASISDPFSRVTTFGNPFGKVASISHFSGRTTSLEIVNDKLVSYTLTDPDASGTQVSPQYQFEYSTSKMVSSTDSAQNRSSYVYDATGRLATIVRPDGKNWGILSQDAHYFPLSPSNNPIPFLNDAFTTITDERYRPGVDPIGIYDWKFRSDRFGQTTLHRSPLGFNTNLQRDSDGLPVVLTEPNGSTTKIGYNSKGDQTHWIAPDAGVTTSIFSTNLSRQLSTTDAVGRTQSASYDAAGNMLTQTDGGGFVTTYTYNARGYPTSLRLPDPDGAGPLGASLYGMAYDSFFRLATITNPDNSLKSFTYNSADQLLTQVDELDKTITFGYDLLGRQTSSTNRVNAVTNWTFDSRSRLTRQVDPMLNPVDIQYNNRGWISKITYPDPDGDSGALTRAQDIRSYEPNGNLISTRDSRGNFQGTLTYQYDANNRLVFSGNDLYGTLGERYSYNNRNMLTDVERVKPDANSTTPPPPLNSFTPIVQNEYDSVGRLTKRTTWDFNSSNPSLPFRELFEYNMLGELTARVDGADASGQGNRYINSFDNRGLLLQESLPDPDGAGPQFPLTIKYSYDNMGRPIQSDRGFGRITNLVYNSRSWVTQVLEPDPDGSGPIVRPVSSMHYDLRGDIVVQFDPQVRAMHFGYDDEQRRVYSVDPDPDGVGPTPWPVTSFGYNANNWLTYIQDPANAVTSFTYDKLGRMTSTSEPDPDGAGPQGSPISTMTYSMTGLALSSDPMARNTQYVRDSRGRVTAMIDPQGNQTDYSYSYYDKLRSRTEPDSDGAGLLVRPKYEYFYDTLDRLTSEVDPYLKSAFYRYDPKSGKVSQITDRNGNTSSFAYDGQNRLISETNANGAARSYTYDVAGNLTRTIDRNRNVTQFSYDALDRSTTEQWLEYSISQGYLQLPETVVFTPREGQTTGQSDAVGWTTNATGMSGTFTLTFNGFTTSPIAWNADSNAIQNAFQALPSVGIGNASVTASVPNGFGAFGKYLQITFQGTKAGSLLPRISISTTGLVPSGGFGSSVTPAKAQFATPGQTVIEQQLIRITGLSSGTWRISYGGEVSGPLSYSISDASLKQVLDGFASIDNISVFSYFSQGSKFIRIEFGGAQAGINMAPIQLDTSNLIGGNVSSPVRTITTNYNASNEIMSVVDPTSTVSFARDNMGRATTVATTIATLSKNVSLNQVFDAANNRTELRATVGSTPDFKNNYTYDKLRRLTDVVQTSQAGGNPVVSKHITQAFNAASQRTNITRYQSAGTTNLVARTNFSYDTVGRLSGIGHTQGATNLNTYSYNYDFLSRLSSVTSTAEGTTDFSYYDDSQLKSATGTQTSQNYSYDANGNRNMTGYSTITDNRTTVDPNFNYTYDAEGNITRKTNKTTLQVIAEYEWDHRNRLTRVVLGGVTTNDIKYEYDPFNRLVRKMRGGTNLDATYWVYDEGINPVLQFDTGGSNGVGGVSHRYIWSDYIDDLLSDEQISFPSISVNTLWPLADHLGSIRDIADFNESTGITAIANHRTYDSFGKLRQETGIADIQFGYTGKLYEKRTGLQNNLNRWYDPNLGKWISQDPIGFSAGDANLYRYVGNKPTNATDPSGLAETWWEWFFPPYTPPGTRQFGSHGIHLEDSYSNNAPQIEGMTPRPIPTQVCHGMSALGRVGPCNSFRFSEPGKIEQYIVFQDHMANMAMMASSQIGLIRSGMVAPVKTGLPELPSGYHYRTVGGRSVVARNPGRAGDLPQMHLDANVLKSGPVPRSTGGYWDWANVRQRLGSSGWAESGQDVHHWMIPRNGWGKNVPEVVKNQKWNLMRMPSRSEHFRVHGWSFDGQPGYNLPTRLWRGTPTPAKLKIGGGIVVVGAGYYYFSE